jgi:hypothetical protein
MDAIWSARRRSTSSSNLPIRVSSSDGSRSDPHCWWSTTTSGISAHRRGAAPTVWSCSRKARSIDRFAFYFELVDGRDIFLSTAPDVVDEANLWRSRVWILPAPVLIQRGDSVGLRFWRAGPHREPRCQLVDRVPPACRARRSAPAGGRKHCDQRLRVG